MIRVLLLALFLALPGLARAEVPAAPEGEVGEVVVRGTRWIEEAAVLAKVDLRVGDRLSADRVRRDLDSVYGTGLFQDVRLLADDLPDGRVKVIIEVVEKPAVVDVRLEGNKKIKDEDLREKIDVESFGVLNEAKIQESVRLLRDAYVEKGFYLAQITPRIEEVGRNRVDVVFDIIENRKVLVQRVDFSGNDNVPDRKIRKSLQTKAAGPLPWLFKRGNFDRSMVEIDQQIVQQVYLEEGFVDVRVDPPKVYLSPDKRFIYVSFHVDEGPQYEVREVEVTGDFVPEEGLTADVMDAIVSGVSVQDIQLEQWRISKGKKPRKRYALVKSGAKIETGDTFKLSTMQQVQFSLARMYQDRGYAFANVSPIPIPDREAAQVKLQFRVDKGEKYRIGRISISGNDPTFDKVVRRELLMNEGELYRGSLLDASRLRLLRLGFFESADITTPRGDGEDVLDVNVKVVERPTGSFSLGVGFGTAEGFQVNGSVQKNNFLGLGYNVNASAAISQRQQTINVQFTDPYFLDKRWLLTVNAFWDERQLPLPQYRRGGAIRLGKYVDRLDDILVALEYEIRDDGLRNLSPNRQRLYGGRLFANGLTSSIGVLFTADKRNNRISPTQGFFASASASLSGGFRAGDDVISVLGGDFNFLELQANFRFYQPIIPRSDWLVFRFNSSLGALFSLDGNILPFVHRYQAGGIYSVRGYPLYSLGPRVRTGTSDDPSRGDGSITIGGTQSWINNFELEAPIVRSAGIKAVAFFDVGNVFGDAYGNGGIDVTELRTSAGFGVRWQSPIGPLRFELGFPLNPRENERTFLFDFGIGNFF